MVRSIYGAIASGVVMLNPASEIVDANAAAQEMLGLRLSRVCFSRGCATRLFPCTRIAALRVGRRSAQGNFSMAHASAGHVFDSDDLGRRYPHQQLTLDGIAPAV